MKNNTGVHKHAATPAELVREEPGQGREDEHTGADPGHQEGRSHSPLLREVLIHDDSGGSGQDRRARACKKRVCCDTYDNTSEMIYISIYTFIIIYDYYVINLSINCRCALASPEVDKGFLERRVASTLDYRYNIISASYI